jgi:hypothetical protein
MRLNTIAVAAIAGFSAIVVAAIGAMAWISVTHDGAETQQIIGALTSIVSVFVVVAGYVAKDLVNLFSSSTSVTIPTNAASSATTAASAATQVQESKSNAS